MHLMWGLVISIDFSLGNLKKNIPRRDSAVMGYTQIGHMLST